MPKYTHEQLTDLLFGPPKSAGQRKLEDFKKKGIEKPEKPKTAGEFEYDETKAEELGLEELELPAYPETQALIEEVKTKGGIDITTSGGQEKFCTDWMKANPNLPMPCVPSLALWKTLYPGRSEKDYPLNTNKEQGNFWYLQQLAAGKIISNPEGNPIPLSPKFNNEEILLVDSWKEQDYDASDASTFHRSNLLKALLNKDSTVNISQIDIDTAMWEKDLNNSNKMIPTEKHKAILTQLDVDPTKYELRLISQDEYARGSTTKGWGQKKLWTWFNEYYLLGGDARRGLDGGYRAYGGASIVDNNSRGFQHDNLAVRLVLSRKLAG